MFNFLRHKKDKYPLHDEEHIVHNVGRFPPYMDDMKKFHKNVNAILDKINTPSMDNTANNRHSILEYKNQGITLVLGNYRGLALMKKYAHPERMDKGKSNFTWEICWLSYGFDYKESTIYKWYIADLPEVMSTEVFRDINAVVTAANTVINADSSVQFNRVEMKD